MSKRHLVSLTGRSLIMLWNVMIVSWLEQFDLCAQNITTIMKCLGCFFSVRVELSPLSFVSGRFLSTTDVSVKNPPNNDSASPVCDCLLESGLTSMSCFFSTRSRPRTRRTQMRGETSNRCLYLRQPKKILTRKGIWNVKQLKNKKVSCCFLFYFLLS